MNIFSATKGKNVFTSKKAKNITLRQVIIFMICFISCFILIILVSFIFYEPRSLRKTAAELVDENAHLLEQESETILSSEQRARLALIQTGQLTRANIEIVIARYTEDISWSSFYSNLVTIYDKSNGDKYSIPIDTDLHNNVKIISLPNIGRECNTYLHHIVNNYHNLADVTVFTQGSAPTRGYHGHRNGGGHLLGNSTFHDYVLNPNGHFIFTGALWFPTAAHIIRYGYNSKTVSRQVGQRRCFDLISDTDGVEMNGRFSLSYVKIVEHIANRCIDEKSTFCSVPLFWDRFIKLKHPPGDVVYFAQGAIFSVTSEQIHRRPLSDYESLLKECSKSSDPAAGFFMEWLWYYLFTSDINPCLSDIFDTATKSTSKTSSTTKKLKETIVTDSSSSIITTTTTSSSNNFKSHKAFEWASRLPYYEHFDFPTRVRLASSTLSTYIVGIDPKRINKKRRKTFLRSLFHIT